MEREAKLRVKSKDTSKRTLASLGVKTHSMDKIEHKEGISVAKLDMYTRNMQWAEKKKQKIMEHRHEKQMAEINKSLEFAKPIVGAHIKPSVGHPHPENREQPVSSETRRIPK